VRVPHGLCQNAGIEVSYKNTTKVCDRSCTVSEIASQVIGRETAKLTWSKLKSQQVSKDNNNQMQVTATSHTTYAAASSLYNSV